MNYCINTAVKAVVSTLTRRVSKCHTKPTYFNDSWHLNSTNTLSNFTIYIQALVAHRNAQNIQNIKGEKHFLECQESHMNRWVSMTVQESKMLVKMSGVLYDLWQHWTRAGMLRINNYIGNPLVCPNIDSRTFVKCFWNVLVTRDFKLP